MKNLSSYSCPKCGGVLNVDSDHDIYDCPFCGGRFTYIEFHRNILYEQAERSLVNGDFTAAKDKYIQLLDGGATDFRTLQGYLFSIGNIHRADKLNDINYFTHCYTDGIIKLVSEDERYTKGAFSGYFALFPELIAHSKKYEELKAEYHEKHTRTNSLRFVKTNEAESGYFIALVALSTVITTIIAFNLMDKIGLWGFLFVFLIVIAEFVIRHFFTRKSEAKKVPQRPLTTHNELSRETLGSKLQEEKDAYDNTLKKLKELAPMNAVPVQTPRKPITKEKAKDTEDSTLCSKCGGKLTHDKVLKLYKCEFCGITYGYAVVFGTPRKKAYAAMQSGEMSIADHLFLRMLEIDPHDFDALRGRILCAGKWANFTKIRLASYLKWVDLNKVFERVGEAQKYCYSEYREYFDEISLLFRIINAYLQNLIKREMEPNNELYKKECEIITLRFNEQLRKVMDWDVRITSLSPEQRERLRSADKKQMAAEAVEKRDFYSAVQAYALVLVDEPHNVNAWRGLILSTGNWASTEEISEKVLTNTIKPEQLDALILQAGTSTGKEYKDYFDKFAETISYIEPYQTSTRLCEKLTNDQKQAEKDHDYHAQSLIRSKLAQPEYDRKHYRAKFDDSVHDLIRLDAVLFKKEST